VSNHPNRAVTAAELVQQASAKGWAYTRRTWRLTLDCGHIVDRPVRYDRAVRFGQGRVRPVEDVLPAQTAAHCEGCPIGPDSADLSVTITAGPLLGQRLLALMETAGKIEDVTKRARIDGRITIKVRFTLTPEAVHA
jgi:hypothetical protein